MVSNITNQSGSNKQRDPDMVNAEIALKRAARKARENAKKNGVPVVFLKDGKITEDQLTTHTQLED